MNTRFLKLSLAIFAGLSFLSRQAGAYSAELKSLEGEVTYRRGEEESWERAGIGLRLTGGDEIKAGEDSWAELSFVQGHTARLGGGSYMKISSLSEDDTDLELFNGDLISRVRQLSSNQNYRVTTPETVAAVKGTEFAVVVSPEAAETLIKVFSGQVSASDIMTGVEVLISEGFFSRVKKGESPTDPQELDDLEGTGDSPAGDDLALDADDDEDEDMDEPEELAEPEDTEDPAEEPDTRDARQDLRNEIRSAVSDIRTDVRQAQNVVEQKRESDVVTGRTMKDYHGNLVRVEQHLMRPERDTLHFINITKRDNYRYRGRMNVEPSGARLDYFETKIKFNRRIPERVSGWFDFAERISDSDEDFHPLTFEMRISNNADSINMFSEWDYDEEDLKEPDVTFITAREKLQGEWVADTDADEVGDGIMRDSEERIEFWSISPGLRIYRGDDNNVVIEDLRVGMEGWLINNDGRVFNVKDLEDGNINPFDLLKRIAFQMSLAARYGFDDGYVLNQDYVEENDLNRRLALEGFNEANNFFQNNFDLVATPDFAFNLLEELAKNAVFDSSSDD